jgi:hypothetical protein
MNNIEYQVGPPLQETHLIRLAKFTFNWSSS